MDTFIQLVVNGLGKGAVYALLALGFVVIFKATEVVNFALGSLVLVGGYLVYVLRDVDRLVRRGRGRHRRGRARGPAHRAALRGRPAAPTRTRLALLTIGVDVIITEEIVRRVGAAIPFIGDPFDAQPDPASARSRSSGPRPSRWSSALVLITAFFLAFRYTDWGVAMRAQAENREAAALMGIRSSRVTATAWLIAGALAGVAVLFMATQDFSGAGLGRGTHAIALIAFPAAIIGGLDSTAGAVVGGIIVGLTEALSAQYISFDFSKSAVFLVMLVVLVVRPSGLFGTKELTRV